MHGICYSITTAKPCSLQIGNELKCIFSGPNPAAHITKHGRSHRPRSWMEPLPRTISSSIVTKYNRQHGHVLLACLHATPIRIIKLRQKRLSHFSQFVHPCQCTFTLTAIATVRCDTVSYPPSVSRSFIR